MQNLEQARFNMIEQQIRPCYVLEARILALLHHVRREQFVPEDKKAMAFMDMEIPDLVANSYPRSFKRSAKRTVALTPEFR